MMEGGTGRQAAGGSGAGDDDPRPTEAQIRRMVEVFYARVREDDLLGPVFEARIGGEWDAHLDRLTDFWSGVLRASGRYRGNPAAVHADVHADLDASTTGIGSEHFDRWLELFEPVTREVLPEHLARDVFGRAQRMRWVLESRLEAAP